MQVSITVNASSPTNGQLGASPSSFNFNPQTVNSNSSPVVISLVNSGGSPLTITSLTAPAQFIPYFLNQGLPLTLQPNGGYANMQVIFQPAAAGPQAGVIELYNTASSYPFSISLSGTGVAAPVTTGNMQVNATFNGSPWTGDIITYSLSGPEFFNVAGAPKTIQWLTPGSYTLSYTGGGPGGVAFTGITPSPTQQISAGSTTTFTLNFTGQNSFELENPSPLAAVVGAGSSTQIQLGACIVTGATQTVILSASGLPPGASISYSANPVSAGCSATASVATISTSPSTPAGIYTIVFTGTNEDGYVSTAYPVVLTVALPPTESGQMVSVSSTGVQGNNMSGATNPNFVFAESAVSGDGRYVAFESLATNLTANDSSTYGQLFMRDTQAGTTTMISTAADGTPSDQGAEQPSMSQDGRFVVFASSSGNLTSQSQDGSQGIYLYDRNLGAIRRIDLAPDGTAANGTSAFSAISADGRFIAFSSWATNLIAGAPAGSVFVADTTSGQLKLASVSSDGSVQASGCFPQISADGRFVAFISPTPNLVPNVTNGKENAFVHDFATGETTLVNVATDGTQDNGGVIYSSASPLAMSADGRYVTFVTFGQTLAPGYANPNNYDSAFLHDMITGETTPLFIDGQNNILPVSNVSTISPDGRFVTFGSYISGWFHTSGVQNRNDTYLVDRTTGQASDLNVPQDGSAGNGSSGPATGSADGGSVVFSSLSSNLVANDTNGTTDVFEFANPFLSGVRLASLSVASSQLSGGSQTAATVTLNGQAPAGGVTVSLWSDSTAVQPQAKVTIPAGQTSAQVSIETSVVPSETVTALLASYNGGSGVSVLTLEPAAILAASPASYDFGPQLVNAASTVESFTLANSGTAAFALGSITVSGASGFAITANSCPATLAPAAICSLGVQFTPAAAGPASASIPLGSAGQSIQLAGMGAVPAASLAPATLVFGNLSMPGSEAQTATLSNNGNANLTGIQVTIAGTQAADFVLAQDGCTGTTLPPGSTCSISVLFAPKGQGNRNASVSVASSASGSPVAAALAGMGVPSTPVVQWNPGSSAEIYGSAIGSGVLNASATINSVSLAGSFTYLATLIGGGSQVITPASLLPAGNYLLSVDFVPTDAIDYLPVTQNAHFNVNKTPLLITANNQSMAYGTTLPTLTGTIAGMVPGDGITATYTTAATSSSTVGTYPITGTLGDPGNKLGNYVVTNTPGVLTIAKAAPAITWAAPAAITYGAALSATQLDAASTVVGTFAYTPTSGIVLTPGAQTLSVTFTPTDSTDYIAATKSVSITIDQAAAITMPAPGATLPCSSAAFTWTPGFAVTNYWLDLGTAAGGVGAKNLYSSGPTTATSLIVTSLPGYGQTIYATLYSYILGSWRAASPVTYTECGTPIPAAMASPTAGSQLSGTHVTFTWSAGGGLSNYWLNLGTATGGANAKNLYSSGPTSATTLTVDGMPTNGEPIFATLYSESNGTWLSSPPVYTYYATGPAVLTTPAAGTRLTASTIFAWTPGTGITHYWFNLGTSAVAAYAKNIYSGSSTTATSVTVSGIPQYGETLYATLYSYIAGAWQPIVYSYTAAGAPVAAVLTTPTPSIKLASSSETFTWSAGEGVTYYWFNLGTSPVPAYAKNIYSGSSTTQTSASVTGLPANGETIYATLYSYIAGAWRPTVYTYTASGSPTPAALTIPEPGTALTSSTVTFTWSAGSGVTYYWLNLGTAASGPNAKNIYSVGENGTTSVTVTDLPTNGETIYATLYSYIGGVWQPTNYTYKAE